MREKYCSMHVPMTGSVLYYDSVVCTQMLPNFWLYIFSTIRSFLAVWEWSNSTCFFLLIGGETKIYTEFLFSQIYYKRVENRCARKCFEWVVVDGVFLNTKNHWKSKRLLEKCFFFFGYTFFCWQLKINISQSSLKMATRV